MTTLTLQPDATAGFDTYTNPNTPDLNQDTATILVFSRADGDARYDYRALIKFDLSALAGKTISAATLYVYDEAGAAGNYDATFAVHRMLAANAGWVEACTWNYAVPSTQRWAGDTDNNGGANAGCTQAGTDYAATPLATLALSNFVVGTERAFTLDLTEFAAMVAANHGMVLCLNANSWQRWGIASSDHATAGYRPKLVVEYTDGAAAGATKQFMHLQRRRRT